ncbi:MAG: glycosyltransferase [Spirochaetota bacterium]
MISVVIPAHNEEAVIARCLGALLDGAQEGELDVVVACNGCTDRTAERAREFGDAVTVIELEKPSKTVALNAADAIAKGFPRLYVDADVILPISSVRSLAAVLEDDEVLLASPVAKTVTSASSSAVRAFYDVWQRLPYNRVMVGTGVYALSERGRKRFGEFPEIIADDGYVRSRFSPQERVAVDGAPVTVYAPQTFGDLVRVKTRGRVGGYELRKKHPSSGTSDTKDTGAILRSLPWGFALPWKLAVYLWLNIVVRVDARRRLRGEHAVVWERDEGSRV